MARAPWGPCTLSLLTALGPWLQLAESAALQILEQMGSPQPHLSPPKGSSASSRNRMEDGGLMEGRKLAHLHVGPGLPLAVPLSSSTGEGLWTLGLSPSELSCPLGAETRSPFPLSTHLGGLLFRLPLTWPPGFSGPGDGRASPPRWPLSFRGTAPSVRCQGPHTKRGDRAPCRALRLRSPRPYPRCCTGPPTGLGEHRVLSPVNHHHSPSAS